LVHLDMDANVRKPMLIIDLQRRITLRNRSGANLLERRDLVFDVQGKLACLDAVSDDELGQALREIGNGDAASQERRIVWLRRGDGTGVPATLHALMPAADARSAHLLFTIFETSPAADIDATLLVTMFDLTPAEARLTALIARGLSTAQCARRLNVKTSTLRTQLSAIYEKTGAGGKADLVRIVVSACAI
jgi:DNA-binding CsgD family transcriptional regulator